MVNMKYETKDKLLKVGFIMCIMTFIVGIIFSYDKCQRDSVEKILSTVEKSLIETVCIKLTNCPRSTND